MDLLGASQKSEHERGPGRPRGAFARTTSFADAARGATEPGPERVLEERPTGGRSPPVPIETAEGIPPFLARRLPPPKVRASPLSPIAPALKTSRMSETARRTHPHRERAQSSRSEISEERSSQTCRSVDRARPCRGGGAVVVRADRAFEAKRE